MKKLEGKLAAVCRYIPVSGDLKSGIPAEVLTPSVNDNIVGVNAFLHS